MFGRQFRQAGHRQHMPNPNSPGYTFERIGSAPRTSRHGDSRAQGFWDKNTKDVWVVRDGDPNPQLLGSARGKLEAYDMFGIARFMRVGDFMIGDQPHIRVVDLVTPEAQLNLFPEGYPGGPSTASRTAARRTAFLDTVHLAEPRHRVAGWDWDDHLNGFIAAEAAREFTCACGDNVPAPGYTDCRCGKRWNCYQVKANGTAKFIAREVPVRENVVMARRTAFRKQAADYSDYSDYENPGRF